MKKREVYEGWRYGCNSKTFAWVKYRVSEYLDFKVVKQKEGIDRIFVSKRKATLNRYSCPCGKGCKPIKCRIIVENEV